MDPQPLTRDERPATEREGLVFVDAGRIVMALARAPLRWLASSTWRATVTLVLWFVMTWVITLVTLIGLLVAWVTERVSGGDGAAIRADVAQALAVLVTLDRERIERFSGARLEPPALPRVQPGASPLERRRAWAQAPLLRRLPSYELICAPAATLVAAVGAAWWWAAATCFEIYSHRHVIFYEQVHVAGIGVGAWNLSSGTAVVVLAVGVVLVLLWPLAIRMVPIVDVAVARRLLGPSSTELSQEVDRLSETRAQAVAAAANERRRIERDLHDGFQPQLVNLAMDLGLAKSRLATDPELAAALLDRAHAEAKRATADLRNLVRGIHPSVLDERGLDAAFSALAASSGVPLRIDVDLTRRPPREVEATAYFLVAEAVTNINKHARAENATVTVSEIDRSLWVLVQDDGHGGARAELGGGLDGLAARLAGVDGTFRVTSPEGGPTWIEALIPCE